MKEKTDPSIHRSFVVQLYDGAPTPRGARLAERDPEPELLGSGDWRGRVEHVVSGAAREFRSADELLEFFREVLRAAPGDGTAPRSHD